MFHSFYNDYQAEFIGVIQSLDYATIEEMVQKIEEARLSGNQVFLIGNGGSAASASHWACDFGKGINVEGSPRLKVISLADNHSLFSAFGNDVGFENVFVEPLKNLLRQGDIVIGLSVSGDSENVVRAFDYARECGATILSLVGEKEGRMKSYSDSSLVIPSNNYGVVEDVHMFVNHVISQYIRKENEKAQVLGDL